jgi:nitronate monooxygenase
VQVGTAYLFCPEAKVNPVHREALQMARDDGTALTNVFTGRAARSLVNRLVREIGPISDVAPQFPAAAGAVQALSDEGSRRGLPDFTPLWAGQAAALGHRASASDLTRSLSQDAFALLRSLAEQTADVRPTK